MNQEQMTSIHASKLALRAMEARVNTLLGKIDTDKKFTRKLPKQHARIIRACKVAKREGTRVTIGMFEVLTTYA